MIVLAAIALLVVGPKDLPKILRAAGRAVGQVRRFVTDVRRETGLDEILRGDFQDLERLADHIEGLEHVRPKVIEHPVVDMRALREREYPAVGADAFGLLDEGSLVYGDVVSGAPSDLASSETPAVVAPPADAPPPSPLARPLPEGVVPQGAELST
jgi:sec-independent protein translocase protein TatB